MKRRRRRRRLRVLSSILLAGLCACRGPGSPAASGSSAPSPASSLAAPGWSEPLGQAAPPTPGYEAQSEDASRAIGKQLCDAIRIPGTVAPGDAAEYEQARRKACLYAWGDSKVAIARDGFARCLDALAKDAPTIDDEILSTAECRRAVHLVKRAGELCATAFGCGADLVCHPARQTCEAAKHVGDTCAQDFECTEASDCRGGACVARLAERARCREEPLTEPSTPRLPDCQAGLFCVDDHCAKWPGKLGQRCDDFSVGACARGLQCNDSKCVAAAKAGESCRLDGECAGRVCRRSHPDRPGQCF